MPLNLMEHYLVLTKDIDATRKFYLDVLGLVDGFRPDLGFPGYWLYIAETPVIHIAEWATYTVHSEKLGIPVSKPADSTGSFDHVAFNGSNFQEMVDKLTHLSIPYERNDVPGVGLIQLFLDDPNGIKLELNYRD